MFKRLFGGEREIPPQDSIDGWEQLRLESSNLSLAYENVAIRCLNPQLYLVIPPEKVALTRYWAMTSILEGLENLISTAQDPKVIEGAKRSMTRLLVERDEQILSFLPSEGAIDDEAIRKYASFRQHGGEPSQAIGLLLQTGLADQLTPRNFRALGALGDAELRTLQLLALSQGEKTLEGFLNGDSRPGIRPRQERSVPTWVASRYQQIKRRIQELTGNSQTE